MAITHNLFFFLNYTLGFLHINKKNNNNKKNINNNKKNNNKKNINNNKKNNNKKNINNKKKIINKKNINKKINRLPLKTSRRIKINLIELINNKLQ